uniref:Sodium/calcium exchanger membrane region domain-containing protein n=1 Tax=Hippocampus comes TaxID=109280 RepID=A0A3Q3DKI4_HIPCM
LELTLIELLHERRIARAGPPALGQHAKLEVVIEESYEFKNAVDEVLKKTRLAVLVGTTSWREQFAEAVTIGADDDGGKKPPSAPDYAVHFLTVFWKLLFALVPPADYWNGWACFAVSIAVIGVLTALIGDLASHFGCTVGLKDSVTAVVFVALGTSVPGRPSRSSVRIRRGPHAIRPPSSSDTFLNLKVNKKESVDCGSSDLRIDFRFHFIWCDR